MVTPAAAGRWLWLASSASVVRRLTRRCIAAAAAGAVRMTVASARAPYGQRHAVRMLICAPLHGSRWFVPKAYVDAALL